MRPDRIVVGEVRGAEALDMLQAMNTGHEGSLSTCHANSPAMPCADSRRWCSWATSRCRSRGARASAAALDLVVHVARRPDGTRHVAAVAEVAESAHRDARTHLVSDGERVVRSLSRPAPVTR